MERPMRKKFVQFAALLLAFCLIPLIPASAVEDNPIIRVGLYYGSSALDGANLANSVGSGFRFGYYDSFDQFVELAYTEQTAISVVKTTNVYYGSYNSYTSYHEALTGSSVAVGCYHVQLPGAYSTYIEAAQAASWYEDGFAAYIDGAFYARVGNFVNRSGAEKLWEELARSGVTAEIVGTSSYGVSIVITGTNTILFQFDSTDGLCLGVKPGLDDRVQTETLFRNNTYYGGFQYQRIGGGGLTVSNVLPMEDYIQGVIIHEMSPSWPLEALKAQAVCARTYAYRTIQSGKHSDQGFDICNTTDCQVYSGISTISDTSRQAVEETYGQYAFYNGELAETFYFSCDGGATEDSGNVWTDSLPYLRGKTDPYEALVEDKIPNYHWTVTYTGKELQARLNSLNDEYNFGEIADLYVSRTTETGNVYSIVVVDVNGKSQTFSKGNARTVLGCRSLRFTISGGSGGSEYSVTDGNTLSGMTGAWVIDGDSSLSQIRRDEIYAITGSGVEQVTAQAGSGSSAGTGTFVISGTGNGHNVGMSQWGAYAMAQQGYTYQDILKFYFTGIEIYS